MLSWQLVKSTTICLVVAGCAHASSNVVKPAIPHTEAECIAKGGSWSTLGLPMPDKPKSCDLRATDSGKACSDSNECQGICVAPTSAQVGSHAAGQCSAYLSNFGNVRQVTGGIVEELNVE